MAFTMGEVIVKNVTTATRMTPCHTLQIVPGQ